MGQLISDGLNGLESSNRSYVEDLCGHGIGLTRLSSHGSENTKL